MSELSIENRPELSILGIPDNPQPEQHPAADFLNIAAMHNGPQEITQALEAPGMPEAAIKSHEAREANIATTASPALLAIGKLLVESRQGSWLDPDQETWSQIMQDGVFRQARDTFSRLTDRDEAFTEARYAMTRRILAIFCLRYNAFGAQEQQATQEIA